jgi:hypothetical protein
MGIRVIRKKSDKEVRKEAKLEKTKRQIKEDPTRNSNRTKRKLKKLDKTAKQLGVIKIAAGDKKNADGTYSRVDALKSGGNSPGMKTTPFYKGGDGVIKGLSYEGQGGKNYETNTDSSTDEKFVNSGSMHNSQFPLGQNYHYNMPKAQIYNSSKKPISKDKPGTITLSKPKL